MTSSPTSITNIDVAKPRTDLPHFAIIGKAGGGKTTLVKALRDELGYAHLSFAYNLKRIAVDLWGVDAVLNRGLMQDLGLKMREIDPDVWCNRLIREIDDEANAVGYFLGNRTPPPVAIDDCRFPNEYAALRARDFVFVRVVCPEAVRVDRLKAIGKFQTLEQLQHVSETALDDIQADYTIDTDGPTADAIQALADVVNRERVKR